MSDEQLYNEQFEELCAGYVLHALEPEEKERFEEMLREASQEQTRLFHSMFAAANQLAFTVKGDRPSDSVKQQLMEYVRQEEACKDLPPSTTPILSAEKGEEDTSGSSKAAFAIAASFALLLLTLSLVFYSFNLSSQLSDKNRIIDQQEARITQLIDEIERKEEMLSILEAREIGMVLMSGLEASPDGYGKVIWDAEHKRALLQVSNLPAVPQDKDYQLWIIKNNQPVSAGVFAINNANSDSFFKIEQMDMESEQAMDAFAVTMEPKGGMPQPTGETYLFGNMRK